MKPLAKLLSELGEGGAAIFIDLGRSFIIQSFDLFCLL
jgi:hypothetical protein